MAKEPRRNAIPEDDLFKLPGKSLAVDIWSNVCAVLLRLTQLS